MLSSWQMEGCMRRSDSLADMTPRLHSRYKYIRPRTLTSLDRRFSRPTPAPAPHHCGAPRSCAVHDARCPYIDDPTTSTTFPSIMSAYSTRAILVVLTLFACLAQLVMGAAVRAQAVDKRDVFVPPVLYPHAGTVWAQGQTHNVTW